LSDMRSFGAGLKAGPYGFCSMYSRR
jgi:hypothetical protein